jgi:hypothetical protein
MRFRSRHFAGDAAVACSFSDNIQSPDPVDPRGSPAFVELDNIISSFKSSFPAHLKTPIHDNIVDSHLYTAFLMPHLCVQSGNLSRLLLLTTKYSATVVLHDPHADVQQSGCISALKILTAARGILDLIYSICSTSYDITLLDSFCSVSLFHVCRQCPDHVAVLLVCEWARPCAFPSGSPGGWRSGPNCYPQSGD